MTKFTSNPEGETLHALLMTLVVGVLLAGTAVPVQAQADAGTITVTSPAAALSSQLDWRLNTAGGVLVGPGHPAGDFGTVAGGLLLTGARFVVLDGLGHELLWFGPEGQLLRKSGSRGAGPGEFQQPSLSPTLYRDSVPVSDRMGRISLFDSDGSFGRKVESRMMLGSPKRVVGAALAVLQPTGVSASSSEGWQRNKLSVTMIDLATGVARPFLQLDSPWFLYTVAGGQRRRWIPHAARACD